VLVLVASFAVIVNCVPAESSQPTPTPLSSSAQSARPTEPLEIRPRTACAARVLAALVDAINARDEIALGRITTAGPAPGQAFQWVSITAAGVNETEYTADGARHVLLRHATQGERWTLGTVIATDGPSWHGGVDAEVHLERRSRMGVLQERRARPL
jgi:hypothetical protein